jgi:hypothetical protein
MISHSRPSDRRLGTISAVHPRFFFLLSAEVFFLAPSFSASRSMTGGAKFSGSSGHRARHCPLARPLGPFPLALATYTPICLFLPVKKSKKKPAVRQILSPIPCLPQSRFRETLANPATGRGSGGARRRRRRREAAPGARRRCRPGARRRRRGQPAERPANRPAHGAHPPHQRGVLSWSSPRLGAPPPIHSKP